MPSKYPARNLTPEQIDQCLLVLAEHGGNAERAREQLEEHLGKDAAPSRDTLRRWRQTVYVDRYMEMAHGLEQARKDQRVTQGFREMAQQSQDTILAALTRLQDELGDIETKDLSKTAQQLAVTAGIATEKALLLENRPTAITEVRNPDWYSEQARALGLDLDAEAEEIPDAEVVE